MFSFRQSGLVKGAMKAVGDTAVCMWCVPENIAESWQSFCDGALPGPTLRDSPIVQNVFDHVLPLVAGEYKTFSADVLSPEIWERAVFAAKAWDTATGGRPELDGLSFTAWKYVALCGKVAQAIAETAPSSHDHVDTPAMRIVEIGGGLGGGAIVLSHAFACSVTSVDLPSVARCISRVSTFCKAATPALRGDVATMSGDDVRASPVAEWDVVVSEHAWSECPRVVRRVYVDTFFQTSRHGVLTCNTTDPDASTAEEAVALCSVSTHSGGTPRCVSLSPWPCGPASFGVHW